MVDGIGFVVDGMGFVADEMGFVVDGMGFVADEMGFVVDEMGFVVDVGTLVALVVVGRRVASRRQNSEPFNEALSLICVASSCPTVEIGRHSNRGLPSKFLHIQPTLDEYSW